ncbi:MAG: stage V sporulation protein AC [Oscillospiraceae bacterium]|nr:stage V sporulation protein AC [Oscillospiraceae bacterium]
MDMTNAEYNEYVKKKQPASPLWADVGKAFAVGGAICAVGQALMNGFLSRGLARDEAGTAVSLTLVFVGALLTGLGVYDDIARFAGAGTLVPITGFANSVVAPALEFKREGLIPGTAAKMFTIAGPVIVYGVGASILYGIALVLFGAG